MAGKSYSKPLEGRAIGRRVHGDHSIRQRSDVAYSGAGGRREHFISFQPRRSAWGECGHHFNRMASLLKLTSIGPFFIVLGALLSALPIRLKMLGKVAFYFGFIFFSLEVVSFTLKPLAGSPVFTALLSRSSSPLAGVIAGLLITAIVQSSSITTGLCILLVQQNLMPVTAAIPIVIGANIGTTTTALVASITMQNTARRVALGESCFNVLGVLLFLPFLKMFALRTVQLAGDPGMAVAWAQLIFNLVMAFAVLVLLRFFHRHVESLGANASRELVSQT